MPNESGIEWLIGEDGSKGLTVNPVIGCERISPGCGGGYIRGPNGEQGGCWAEELVSTRMSRNPRLPMYADLARPGGGWSGVVKLVPERLKEIVALGRRKRGSRVFVCDMSDLFHEDVPFEFIAAVWGAMASAPGSLFYVLTKRSNRALEFAAWMFDGLGGDLPGSRLAWALSEASDLPWAAMDACFRAPWPLPNVVFGVTCEDPRYGVPRLDQARAFPARWRFASVEPLLADLGPGVDFTGFDLVVEGGEAGPSARPHDLAWARNVRDAARKTGTRFFMKQAGDYVIDSTRTDIEPKHARMILLGKKGNDLAKLPEDLRIRENIPMPEVQRHGS